MTTLDLNNLTLAKGGHNESEGQFCLLEAAAYMAGEPWSDHPQCVSPVLGTFGRNLNDVLPDGKRQQLKPLLPSLLNTAADGLDEQRSYLALDWLIRTYLPSWLRLVPALVADADLLANSGPITTPDEAAAIGDAVRQASSHAAAAGDAAWDAAGDAAGDAAWAAAWDAAGDAAWAAAGDAAWDAAWAAAGAAAWDAAWAAAGAAAWAAAWDAAGAAAWDAAGAAAGDAAWDAAWAAAWDALNPTVDALQDSAIALYGRMILPAAHNTSVTEWKRTVYLAGPYVARETVAEYGAELAQVGYAFRARWCDGTHEVGPHGAAVEATLEDRQRWAHEDLEDVRAADVLVAFTAKSVLAPAEVGKFGTSGGRHVETGYALGQHKDVVLIGEPENVFHWLPAVRVFADWHSALIWLAGDLVERTAAQPQEARAAS